MGGPTRDAGLARASHPTTRPTDQGVREAGKTTRNLRRNIVLSGIGGLALRQDTWKYVPATAVRGGMGSGANSTDERFAAANIPSPLLFDLATDPKETTNVIARHPRKALEMARQLEAIKTRR